MYPYLTVALPLIENGTEHLEYPTPNGTCRNTHNPDVFAYSQVSSPERIYSYGKTSNADLKSIIE
jgi:hypothetical protein